MKIFSFFLVLFTAISFTSQAQLVLKGKVLDSTSKSALAAVRIENGERKTGTSSNDDGSFTIEGALGDHIIFSMVGHKNRVYILNEKITSTEQLILMPIKPLELKQVIVRQKLTPYQEDSIKRANIYEDAFNYQQSKTITSPITTVYQMFSKKHKDIRHFQEQIVNTEEQKFIDTRYTPELVQSLTKLPKDSIPSFMNSHPMEYDFARAATDLEIKMWIKYNFEEFTNPQKVKKSIPK